MRWLKSAVRNSIATARNVRTAYHVNKYINAIALRLGVDKSTQVDTFPANISNKNWHQCYSKINGIKSPYYVTEELFFNNIEPYYCRFERTRFLEDKNNFDKLGIGWVGPRTVLRLIEGRFYDRAFRPVDPMHALQGLDEVVVKPARDTGNGRGVHFVARADFAAKIAALGGRPGQEDLAIQEPIRQSGTMAALNPTSVNTIRVMTRCFDGEAQVLCAVVRMGRPGSRVDNNQAGGLHVGLDDNGRLKALASNRNFEALETVPGTDLRFAGYEISAWPKARALVLDLQQHFPEIGLMSWDVAIDENEEPVIIEVNLREQGLNLLQIHHGPLFGDSLPAILAKTRPRIVFGHVVA